MKIKKSYQEVNPELLFAEVRDFALKQGVSLGEANLETYTQPDQSASFITRGTLTFTAKDEKSRTEQECLRAHLVGSIRGESKLMLDADERLFPREKIVALQDDLDFIFGSREIKS